MVYSVYSQPRFKFIASQTLESLILGCQVKPTGVVLFSTTSKKLVLYIFSNPEANKHHENDSVAE